MATFQLRARRIVLAGGFAAAVAIAPAIAVFAGPGPTVGVPSAACPAGDTEDPYTFACVPELVPGGGGPVVPVGAPSEQELTACGGRDQSQCLESQLYGSDNVGVPNVSTEVQQSP
jgi:hypothetical protein